MTDSRRTASAAAPPKDDVLSLILDLRGQESGLPSTALPSATLDLIARIRSWASRVLPAPVLADLWQRGAPFPPAVFRSFVAECGAGCLGLHLPPSHGGAGLDAVSAGAVTAELFRADASFGTTLLVHWGLAADSIAICGNGDQKRRFLADMIALRRMACFCLTEPDSGSDASGLKTTAELSPDGSYAISGRKTWIGNATSADLFVIWARNISLPGSPVQGFVLSRSAQTDPASIVTVKIENKTSLRIIQNAHITFAGATCQPCDVLPPVGFGPSVGRVLAQSRLSVAWAPVGMCGHVLDLAAAFVRDREAFGAPLASNQLIQERLVRMAAAVATMRLLAGATSEEVEAGRAGSAAAAMAKAHNTRVGREVVAMGRELLGGRGVLLEDLVAMKFCDMEAIYTYEGTYDMNVLVAGRAITGIAAIKSSEAWKRKSQQTSKL